MQPGTKKFIAGAAVGALIVYLLLRKKKCPPCPGCGNQNQPVTTLYPAFIYPPAPVPPPPPPPPPPTPPPPPPVPEPPLPINPKVAQMTGMAGMAGFQGWGRVK